MGLDTNFIFTYCG